MSQGVNSQSGTSYTVRKSDRGKLITFTNAAPVAVTVPQAIGAFGEGFSFDALNRGSGTVTFTPTSSTINGAATLALTANNFARITSDGANWDAGLSGTGPAGPAGTPATVGGSDKQLQYNNNGILGGIDNGTTGFVLVSQGTSDIPTFADKFPALKATANTGGVDSIALTGLHSTPPVSPPQTQYEVNYNLRPYPGFGGVGTVYLILHWIEEGQAMSFTSAIADLNVLNAPVCGVIMVMADVNTVIQYETVYVGGVAAAYKLSMQVKQIA